MAASQGTRKRSSGTSSRNSSSNRKRTANSRSRSGAGSKRRGEPMDVAIRNEIILIAFLAISEILFL